MDCRIADLPLLPWATAYWACSAPLALDLSGFSFRADLYLSNNDEAHSNPVTVTLGYGTCGQEQSFVAIASPVTLNIVDYDPEMDCGFLYHFDFGVIETLILSGQRCAIVCR